MSRFSRSNNPDLNSSSDKPTVRLLGNASISSSKMSRLQNPSLHARNASEQENDEENDVVRRNSKLTVSSDDTLQSSGDDDYSKTAAFLIFLFPALGGLLFGYDIGATSAVVAQLKSINYSGVSWHSNVVENSSLQGVITAMSTLGALIGSIACFRVADVLGRRRCLLLSSSFFLSGAIIEVISGDVGFDATTGIAVLLLGRLIYGFGCGFALVGAPAYIGEMAPSSIRGLLVSLKEVFIVLGITFGYTFGYIYSHQAGGWRYTYGLSIPFTIIMFIGMYNLPYSARWLALKGRLDEARISMKFVTPKLSETHFETVKEASEKAALSASETTFADDYRRLTSPSVFPAMIAGVGLVFFQQVTGQPSVLYYADSLFLDVGLSSYSSILVSLFKLVATLVATFTVDSQGRKLLLYVGCSLMLIALVALGTAFLFPYSSSTECNTFVSDDTCISTCVWNTATCGVSTCVDAGFKDSACTCCGTTGIGAQKGIILAALFVYIGGYQVGFGPISWLLISEIFPLEVRGKAITIAVVTNFFWNTVTTFLFPVELEYIGSSTTFFVYAAVLLISIAFIKTRVPETKGMSLEQIEEYFVHTSKTAHFPEEDKNSETRSDLSGKSSRGSYNSEKVDAMI